MEIKRFLGFTDNIKEPRKTKIEQELRTIYSFEGKFCNEVNFLCDKLLKGYYLEKKENCQHYKKNGELSKPKTEYRYWRQDGSSYFEMNKTQYDFVSYLIGKGLKTEEAMANYDMEDMKYIEELKMKKAEENVKAEIEERKRQEEKERMDKIIARESQNISEKEKEIVDNIFISMYGKENAWNYSLVALIHNFDNEYCKEEIVSRLHNDNKASIKVFECITGLKLPKSYKERKLYLETLTMADFKEMTEYKPRKKRGENKKVLEEEFYINENTPEGQQWTKVIAEPFTRYGVDMFIRCRNGIFSISLAEAGMKVCDGKTKTECINKLKKFVNSRGKETFLQMVKDATEKMYKSTGINPRYKVA